MNTIEIRKPQIEELSLLVDMYEKFINYLRYDCEEPYFTYDESFKEQLVSYFRKNIDNPLQAVYLAVEEGVVAGFIAGDIRPSFFPFGSMPANAYISALFIEYERRNKGISQKLIEHIIIHFFKKNKVEYIELHCLTKNTRAKQLWKKYGFSTFREQMRKKI